MKKILILTLFCGIGLIIGNVASAYFTDFETLEEQEGWSTSTDVGVGWVLATSTDSYSGSWSLEIKDFGTGYHTEFTGLGTSTSGAIQFYVKAVEATGTVKMHIEIGDTFPYTSDVFYYNISTTTPSGYAHFVFQWYDDHTSRFCRDSICTERKDWYASSTGAVGTSIYIGGGQGSTHHYIDFFSDDNCGMYTTVWTCLYEDYQNPTGICRWNYDTNVCESQTGTCGEYEDCEYCDNYTDCMASESCYWQSAIFAWQDSYCYYLPSRATTSVSTTTPTESSTSTYASTEAIYPSALRSHFGNKIPFVYFFAIYDGIRYLINDNATTSLENLSITLPATSYGTTTIIATDTDFAFLDREILYDIVPVSVWDLLKNLLRALIFIQLFFGLKRFINQLSQFIN